MKYNKQERKGCLHIYTGSGKGKTTAALGLALRAAGHDMKTFFGQFLKGQSYGELKSVGMLGPLITIKQFGREDFIHVSNDPDNLDGYYEAYFHISGDYVVWVKLESGNSEIYAHHLKHGITFNVSDNPQTYDTYPEISEDYIVLFRLKNLEHLPNL